MKVSLWTLVFLATAFPRFSAAEVFQCVDPKTGNKVFTDVACSQSKSGKEVQVVPRNFGGNGHRSTPSAQERAWVSQDKSRRPARSRSGHARQVDKAHATANAATGASS